MSTVIEPPVTPVEKHLEEVETVTIRFAGDSGDGMQLTGTQFTNTSAVVGNDISTLPDFPAEIRAPAGSLRQRSSTQLRNGPGNGLKSSSRLEAIFLGVLSVEC